MVFFVTISSLCLYKFSLNAKCDFLSNCFQDMGLLFSCCSKLLDFSDISLECFERTEMKVGVHVCDQRIRAHLIFFTLKYKIPCLCVLSLFLFVHL